MVFPPCGISKKIGDVDGDGDITQSDVDLAFNLIGGTLTKDQIIRIDVNGNGRADYDDVSLLQNYVNGTITTFPVCTRSTRILNSSTTLDAEAIGEGPINYEWIITQPDTTEIIPHPTTLSYVLVLNQLGTYTITLKTLDSCTLGSQSCFSPSTGVYYIDVLLPQCVPIDCSFTTTCTGIFGDLNNDNVVTTGDMLKLRTYLNGTITFNSCETIKADLDGDGVITENDYTLLRNYVMETPPYGQTGLSINKIGQTITLNGVGSGEGTINYEWIITQPDLTEITPRPTNQIYDLYLSQSGKYKIILHVFDSCINTVPQHTYYPLVGTYDIDVALLCTQPTCSFSII